MILPGFPALQSSDGGGFPAVTINRANIGGYDLFYGYIRPVGVMSGDLGAYGGTLSGTLVPGYVTDGVFSMSGKINIAIMGNCEALLSGVTALMDNGTPLSVVTPATYESETEATFIYFDGEWTSTGDRTVQLV